MQSKCNRDGLPVAGLVFAVSLSWGRLGTAQDSEHVAVNPGPWVVGRLLADVECCSEEVLNECIFSML